MTLLLQGYSQGDGPRYQASCIPEQPQIVALSLWVHPIGETQQCAYYKIEQIAPTGNLEWDRNVDDFNFEYML